MSALDFLQGKTPGLAVKAVQDALDDPYRRTAEQLLREACAAQARAARASAYARELVEAAENVAVEEAAMRAWLEQQVAAPISPAFDAGGMR